jgi:hypothetical protein
MNWEWKSARKERGNPPFFLKKRKKHAIINKISEQHADAKCN